MLRLVVVFLLAALVAFFALALSGGRASSLFEQPVAIVVAMCVLVGALSMAFHTFIDGVVKDLPMKDQAADRSRLIVAIDALSDLRREVIENAVLVLAMLVLFAGISGMREWVRGYSESIILDWALLSLQFSCFVAIVYGAVVQFLGFRTATRLRDVLAKRK